MTPPPFDIETRETHVRCNDDFDMPAVIASPAAKGPFPGLLFIGEPFGLNSEMRRVCAELAAAGYVVLAPDLTARKPWFRCVRALMRAMQEERGQGMDDLLAARQTLRKAPGVDANRLGVIGLCMGGGFALLLAKKGLFQVSAPFYGHMPQTMDGACPIVASFGGRDRLIRPHAVKLGKELARIGAPHDLKIYPKAGHSFMTRPPNLALAALGPILPARAGHEPEAAADATRRVLDFWRRISKRRAKARPVYALTLSPQAVFSASLPAWRTRLFQPLRRTLRP